MIQKFVDAWTKNRDLIQKDCIKGVMTLSPHIVQQMRKMGGDEV